MYGVSNGHVANTHVERLVSPPKAGTVTRDSGCLVVDVLPCETSIFGSWVQILTYIITRKPIQFNFRTTMQVELFTHCFCVQNVVQRLLKEDVRLAAVHLVDAYHCG